MQPLKETKVYIPIDVNVEVPKHKKDVFTFHEKDKWESQCYILERRNKKEKWVNSWDDEKAECYPTHWLKEQTGYFFNKQEMEEFARKSFRQGERYAIHDVRENETGEKNETDDFPEYINKLLRNG